MLAEGFSLIKKFDFVIQYIDNGYVCGRDYVGTLQGPQLIYNVKGLNLLIYYCTFT